jgi:hypothetical protein
MNVYVLGAGVSKDVGYPLGGELLDAVDLFVKTHQREINRFPYAEWPSLCQRLTDNENILIRQAYRLAHFEHLLTVLDHYELLGIEFILRYMATRKNDPKLPQHIEKEFDTHQDHIKSNSQDRDLLLSALAEFLQYRHHEDQLSFGSTGWSDLQLFAKKLQKGDVVITFNYDSCVERVLVSDGKWSPKNGYGFQVEFIGKSPPESEIIILHLHGATGWYASPIFEKDRDISLDPVFLSNLGLDYLDSTLTELSNEAEIIIYPTYMKTYELGGRSDNALVNLWRLAGKALREANKISIVGYSLPQADSAARALLATNCDPNIIEIVNRDVSTIQRLSELLRGRTITRPTPLSFGEWVKNVEARD